MNVTPSCALEVKGLSVSYASHRAVEEVSVCFRRHRVAAIIGPSGCGKSTLLRSLNRMHDFDPTVKVSGQVVFENQDLYGREIHPPTVRKRIGMVFQKPNPFPKSIYKNISWGPWINHMRGDMDQRVESCLRKAALWDEVKHRLHQSALSLSGGQQQRLCIARALAMNPDVILMDEPCSALDPRSTACIEDLIADLREKYTILVVTHNMQQAKRISDDVLFMYEGRLVEFGPTTQIFSQPRVAQTQAYIQGKFG
ncbi:MAG: phosphate ABC transporter ATP-binding protein PstB [Zetaproteobacteria bacterium]|nr:phosphate ABC transporter ATP-binding protein PstB [Zetaproteobacteria bacterium]